MIWFREQDRFFDLLLRVYQDYLHLLLRWCLGLSMAGHFVYCQVLFDWLVELSILDYLITRILISFYHYLFPQELRTSFFESVLLKLIGLWILSYLIGEPLLVIVFSYTLYWLFTMYAQIFSRKPIESLSLFYYFSSFWFVLPVLVNALISLDQLFHFRIFDGFITPVCQYFGLDSVFEEWGFQLKNSEPAMTTTPAVHQDGSSFLGLTPVQKKYYQRIQQKYLTSDAKLVLSENFDDLKECIKRFYQQSPVKFALHSLPLAWESFFSYRMRLGSREQYHAFQAYYQHEMHSAWRLVSSDNPFNVARIKKSTSVHTSFRTKTKRIYFDTIALESIREQTQ